MNDWGSGGGFVPGPSGGSLDLEQPMQRHPQAQSAHHSVSNQHQINLMTAGLENDHHHINASQQAQFIRHNNKGKAPADLGNSNLSDEDDPNCIDNSHGAKGKKGSSPWHRMKWSDEVVRLLIAVVALVGDDGGTEGIEGHKRKSGMILQKKGKWKMVSKIMIKKGCHVSPQQCEDKFNDLNKRYKRLNDILGRGTSCSVVENPALMDSMPQLSAKAKDNVRKILSSKHLFYKEMCAYHNGQRIPNCQDLDLQGYALHLEKENNGSDDEAEGNDSDSDDDDGDDQSEDEDRDNADTDRYMERMESFEFQMERLFFDPSKSRAEQKDWIKTQMVRLQERKLQIQAQSFELDKQRFKWQRYCSKKQRELERLRLENERMSLENERRELQLKQKELEFGPKRPSPHQGI